MEKRDIKIRDKAKKKDPLFAAPKKGHEGHGWSVWSSCWPYNFDGRRCQKPGCRCMHWCCYQQRNQIRRVRPRGHQKHQFGKWRWLSPLSTAFEIGRSNKYRKCRRCGRHRYAKDRLRSVEGAI